MKFKQVVFALTLAAASGGAAQAQHLLLSSPAASGSFNDPITFEIFADGKIGGAVAWGTTVSLANGLSYKPNFDGAGNPYRSLQSYFNNDFTDASAASSGQLKLNFLNIPAVGAPASNFGYNGFAPLAEFQTLLSPGVSAGNDITVTLAALGIPPDGTAVQDSSSNNILLPTDPAFPLNNVSTAHIIVGGGNGHPLSWVLSFGADVPEPTGWLYMAAGMAGGLFLLRRRRVV